MQSEGISAGLTHQFRAIAFEENLSLRQLTVVFFRRSGADQGTRINVKVVRDA